MEDGFSLRDATVGIIGLGLMGGSLALALKGKCARLIGFDTHPPTLELALSKNIIDQADTLALSGVAPRATQSQRLDILVIATPVPAIINILEQFRTVNYHPALSVVEGLPITLLDLGSTKRDILQAMSALPQNFDPVGGHPICGREKLGLENVDANLYRDAPFVITPLERTTSHAIRITQELISAIGANLIEMTAEEHDKVFASTSHLPFLLSSALTLATPKEFAPFAGPGFRSTSRLAGTPASMMLGILESNRDNVLNAIQIFRNSLDEIESALQKEDYPALEAILNESQSNYLSLIDR